MSLNSALSQSHILDLAVVKDELEPYLQQRRLASTQERVDSLEGAAVSFLEQLIDYDFRLINLYKGAQLYREELDEFYSMYSAMLRSNLRRSAILESQFIKYFNSQQIALHHLIGQIRRVRQKRASLALWSTTDYKYVLADHFLNLDFVDTSFTALSSLEVHTAEGLLTLPVSGTDSVAVARITIGSDSNGNSGNSNEVVTTNNGRPGFAVNGDPNNWFEYERLDSGPLQLSLQLELRQEEIVNQVTLQSVNFGNSQAFEVEDILFAVGSETQSILDLAGPTFDADRYAVKSIGNDTAWQITFIPVKTRSITLKLRQNSSYPIEVVNTNRGTTIRNRWAIGLRSVGVNRVRYERVGGINSLIHQLPSGLYAGLPFLQIWPSNIDLYDISLETSIDGGESWAEPENVDEGVGGTILLNGAAVNFVWRLSMERNDSALANAVSFTPLDDIAPKTENLLRIASPNISPVSFRLPTSPLEGQVWAFQPRVLRRGDRRKRLSIGKARGTARSYSLPFDFVQSGIQPDVLGVYLDGLELARTDSVVAVGEYAFSSDFSEIQIADDYLDGDLEVVLQPELMHFTQGSDGYYHVMELPFDSDKTNIVVKYLPRNAQRHSLVLPRDQKTYKLPHANVIEGSVNVFSKNGATWTVTGSPAALPTTSIYVDYKNGFIELGALIPDDTVVFSYSHVNHVQVSDADYDVVFDGARPSGVRINPIAFEAVNVQETISDSPQDRYDFVSNAWAARTPLETPGGDTPVKTLTHKRVIVGSFIPGTSFLVGGATPIEVEYIDGRSEFLGLVRVDDEETIELTDLSGVVTFNLSAGALWDSDLDPAFGDPNIFDPALRQVDAVDVNTDGEWHISAAGLVTVYVGHVANTLPAGITIQYYYVDPDFVPEDKFSVDYREGVVYSYTDMLSTGTCSYKASRYIVEYDIGQPLESSYSRVNNSVELNVENMLDINRKIKIVWPVPVVDAKLRELAPFFSPLIEVFGVRFN